MINATQKLFLSTLSLRRATAAAQRPFRCCPISIHALLAESDNINSSVNTADKISIHALLAESDVRSIRESTAGRIFLSTLSLRRATSIERCSLKKFIFLSTLSLRRATASEFFIGSRSQFLSTLSLRRATGPAGGRTNSTPDFYPRSPCGERPRTGLTCGGGRNISIHALLAESDACLLACFVGCFYFYPRSPCGERR